MGQSFPEQVLSAAIEAGLLGAERPLAAFVDTRGVERTIRSLHDAFPDHFEHTFAAKANTMSRALTAVRQAGMGCEVASPGELEQAIRAGFEPEKLVYDSPAKTRAELEEVLAAGIGLNIDNMQEFERVRTIFAQRPSVSRIGFRLNPQVGAGRIGAMSTATNSSKFGFALEDAGVREQIIACYADHPWLTTLHCHVGSQGCSLELLAAGMRKTVDLAEDINGRIGKRQIGLIDIGGGLPVNFESEEIKPTFAEYAEVLSATVPELFNGEYRGKTEFGRSIYAKSGFIASRIEYTKSAGGRPIAISHAGAQVATRTVFMPDHWKLRLSVYDRNGRRKRGNELPQDVAGPLCFAGDLVARARELPPIEQSDYVVLHDTGAYYFSNPFYYNALPAPAVYGAALSEDDSVEFSVWRQQQTLDAMLAAIG